ncbi:hypothetical protein, partial [Enterobacter hormaechei]|uniref:hypothetical protein n=1 Tax=Enterobacter hormaechei TaxID=158836 RepID=UPI00197F9D8A
KRGIQHAAPSKGVATSSAAPEAQQPAQERSGGRGRAHALRPPCEQFVQRPFGRGEGAGGAAHVSRVQDESGRDQLVEMQAAGAAGAGAGILGQS